MIIVRETIFILGGLFLASIFIYYACVADSLWITALFTFYGLVVIALTVNKYFSLNI